MGGFASLLGIGLPTPPTLGIWLASPYTCIVGNFRGVLIFINFMVNLAIMKSFILLKTGGVVILTDFDPSKEQGQNSSSTGDVFFSEQAHNCVLGRRCTKDYIVHL